jgi:hypothetical protein
VIERAADDFASINARLKEIQGERDAGIKGTPASPDPVPAAPASTVTGAGGGWSPPYGYEG